MPEENSNSGHSEENRQDSGSSNEGSSSTGADNTDLLRRLENLEKRTRDLQSLKDRAEARVRELEGDRSQSPPDSQDRDVPHFDPEQYFSQWEMRMNLREARNALRERFPLARADVLDGYAKYRSVDDFAWAVEQSHQQAEQIIKPEIDRREQEIRAKYESQYGKLREDPDSAGDSGRTPGSYSVDELASMSDEEFSKLSEADIEKLLRSA